MNFRHLQSFNLALLGKHSWHLLSNTNSLVSRLIKARYYPHTNFLEAPLGHNPSVVWRSIWKARSIIDTDIIWRFGNGMNINVWQDPWITNNPNFKPTTPVIDRLEELQVASLWVPKL